MSSTTVPCVACYFACQREQDQLATIHENRDGSWTVHYSDGKTGPAVLGTSSNNPRMCLCP